MPRLSSRFRCAQAQDMTLFHLKDRLRVGQLSSSPPGER
jgi:hypothetical protein